MESTINDATTLGGTGVKGFVTTAYKPYSSTKKSARAIKKYVTSFMDVPFSHDVQNFIIRDSHTPIND